MAGIGATVALIKALAPKADPAVIQQAVEDYLEAHPEISVADGSITEEKLAADVAGILDDLQDDVTDVKNHIQGMKPTAQQSDIGKALILKTIDQSGKPTAYEYGEAGGGSNIDDAAGAGDTNKAWSADKLTEEFETKAPVIKNNVTGNPAVFYDGVSGILIENIKVHFTPQQEGTGDPSKDNVRNLSGWTGVTVDHSGSDTSNPTEIDVSWEEYGAILGGHVDIVTGDLYKTYEIVSDTWGHIKAGTPDEGTGLQNGKLTFTNQVEQCTSQSAYNNGLTMCNVCNKIIWAGKTSSPAHYYISSDYVSAWVAFPGTMSDSQVIQIVGKLKTPVKVATLDKEQIETLIGINQIWSDANGTCEINYSADTNIYIKSRTSGYVTPEMFGASANGITDDTGAITKAISTGKRVVMDGNYYCGNIALPENCEIELHGNIELHGTITINNSSVTISGDGTIKAYNSIAFMLYPQAGKTMTKIHIKGIVITGDNTNTCFALTNTEANAGMCFIHINCDILNFLYGLHSYQSQTNNTWFSALSIEGTILNCLYAVHFNWMGTGSYIKSMIQPKTNAEKTENTPLVIIHSNTIVESMIWDYGQANNKKLIRITGENNKILSPIPVYTMECAAGNDYTTIGDISPLRKVSLNKITSAFSGANVEDTMPIEMPFDNSNDIAYMAGANKVSVSVSPQDATIEGYVLNLLSNKNNSMYIYGSEVPELIITMDFPQAMPLREVVVAGQGMPKSVKIEYKDTNNAYQTLTTRNRGTDYESRSGTNAYAYWQYVYGYPGEFVDNFAKGVRITMTADAADEYMITRIFVGVSKILFANKNGDDLVATSLKLKSGNDYYTLSISNGEVVATLDT